MEHLRPLLLALAVALLVASTGCLHASDGAMTDDVSAEADVGDAGDVEDDGWDGGSPPAPGDLPDEVDARFHVDGEPLENLTLEVVDTPEDRARGLMFREELADDRGMLFVYAAQQEGLSFWMKNTLVPLDIIFIDSDLRVVDVEHAAPDPGDVDDAELPRYTSDAPARYVVEVNRGYANETGLGYGDELEILE